MAKKLSEKQLIDLIASYVLENCSEMQATNDFERSYLKLEEFQELVLKEIHRRLREVK